MKKSIYRLFFFLVNCINDVIKVKYRCTGKAGMIMRKIYKNENGQAVAPKTIHFGKEAFVTVSRDEQEYVTRTELENLKRQMIDAAVSAAKDEIIRISLGAKDEAETASYISRTRMDSQKEEEEPQDDDTISDYALSYLMDGMEE